MALSRLRRGRPFVSTPHRVEVYHPGQLEEDRFGDLRPGAGVWKSVMVSSWWVHRTDEQGEDSVLRTVDLLTMHVPTGEAPAPGGKVRLPDRTEWQVEGHPENYEHGFHGWSPGLVVVNCKRVEG